MLFTFLWIDTSDDCKQSYENGKKAKKSGTLKVSGSSSLRWIDGRGHVVSVNITAYINNSAVLSMSFDYGVSTNNMNGSNSKEQSSTFSI